MLFCCCRWLKRVAIVDFNDVDVVKGRGGLLLLMWMILLLL